MTAEIVPEATPVNPEEYTAEALRNSTPPTRDDVRLAQAYSGAPNPLPTPQVLDEQYTVGERSRFFIRNAENNTYGEIEAELAAIGDHAYFWFDVGPGSAQPSPARLAQIADAFDDIFEQVTAVFGDPQEYVDGRVHIVNASPLALCDASPDQGCWLAGYFSDRDALPRAVHPNSNERRMFVMNADQFETDFYLPVLGHELRHMVESDYDRGDQDWAVEGSAELASDLLGYPQIGQQRGNLFLSDPDLQLNTWSESDRAPHYGQGYLLSRYLYDRMGDDLYRRLATSPSDGLGAVDEVAAGARSALTGESVWLDWLTTMALNDRPDAPEPYRWQGPELQPAAAVAVDALPESFETTVNQYAADYYTLPAGRDVVITFDGQPTTPLLEVEPRSGEHVWYAQRANFSNPRLTRLLDLREVDQATLSYSVYADIEQGYDFAYVSASTDGGETWQPLTAEGMQGLDPADDPANTAYAGRFYTGRHGRWIDEQIDLTPYAGREILLRFEYVTDPILTYGGFVLDDIAVPEIGFSDDAESDTQGWEAEGFVRAAGEVAQGWRLRLITFDDEGGRLSVSDLPLTDGRTAEFTSSASPTGERPILIVAALAPETLQPASYQLSIAQK